MAWIETATLKSGQKRYRVVERGPDERLVKGPRMRSLRAAERLAAWRPERTTHGSLSRAHGASEGRHARDCYAATRA